MQSYEKEPPPLKSEVARAMGQIANGKAVGPDNIPAELFKHMHTFAYT